MCGVVRLTMKRGQSCISFRASRLRASAIVPVGRKRKNIPKNHFTPCISSQSAMTHRTPKNFQENIKPLQHGHPLSTDQKEITVQSSGTTHSGKASQHHQFCLTVLKIMREMLQGYKKTVSSEVVL